MKNYQTVAVAALAVLTIMSGCKSTTDSAVAKSPQRQGDKVIVKNINNLNPMPDTATSGAGCYQLFSSLNDNIVPDCTLLSIQVQPGEELIKHKIKNAMILYVTAGGGNMKIGSHIYVLTPGTAIYVPPNKARHIANKSSKTLQFLMFIVPAYHKTDITVLQKRKPVKLTKEELKRRHDKAVAKKVLGKDADAIGNENMKHIQTLTPQERQQR